MSVEEQIVSNSGATMGALQLILAGGIGAAVVGGILTWIEKLVIDRKLEAQRANYSKQLEEQKAEYNKELEALKSQLEKKNVVHRLQFETEFELYKEFWKTLVDIRRTVRVTPMADIIPPGKQPLEVYKERWKEAADAFNNANDVFDYNRPFYHNDVSTPAGELLSQCKSHLIKVQITLERGEIKGIDIHEENEKIAKMINEAVDKIEDIIKGRIGLLQEAQIIE